MAWRDNKLHNGVLTAPSNYHLTGSRMPFLFGQYRKVDGDGKLVSTVAENTDASHITDEVGLLAANVFQLSVPSSIIPLEYKSQFDILAQMKRYPTQVYNHASQSKLIFTCKGLLLVPDYNTGIDVKTCMTSDGKAIVCYVKDLYCRVVKYFSSSNTSASSTCGFGRYDSTIFNSALPHKTGFEYPTNILKDIAHSVDETTTVETVTVPMMYSRGQIYVKIHDACFTKSLASADGYQFCKLKNGGFRLRSAKGISVWLIDLPGDPPKEEILTFNPTTVNSTIEFRINTANTEYEYSEQAQHASACINNALPIASDHFARAQYDSSDVHKAVYVDSIFDDLFSTVEITDARGKNDDGGATGYATDYKCYIDDDSDITLTCVNTFTAEKIFDMPAGNIIKTESSIVDSGEIIPTINNKFYRVDTGGDKSFVTKRYDSGTNYWLRQSFFSLGILANTTVLYDQVVPLGGQQYSGARYEYSFNIHFHFNYADYWMMYGATDDSALSMARLLSYYEENETTSEYTVNLTYDDISDINKVLTEHYYSLLPQELEYLFKSKADSNGYIFKFTETAKIILQSAFQSHLPNLDADSLEKTIEQYNVMMNARPDKSMFRTPSEYYSESRDATDLTLFDSDRLTSTGSAISSSDVPMYFWVETLKNWCYFKLNNYDTENNTASEAILCVWNGINGWYELGNLLSFAKSTYIDLDTLMHLNITQAKDNALFQGLLKYMLTRLGYYPFPLENLHTVDIDRIYYPCDPKFEGQSKGWFRRQWENIKSFGSNITKIGGGLWDALTSPTAWFTDEDFFDKLFGGWKDVLSGWVGLMGDTWNTFLGTNISVIAEMLESDPNPDFYNSDLDRKIYAKCYYVKLPYDTHYSSNEPSTYQTLRVQHRAEKAYGSIDGGLDYDKVHAAMFNVIPTTIGSPFVVRSSTGELMMAYRMMHSGPVKQDKDKTHNIVKYTGIAQIDVDFSNQLLRSCFGSGDDKTIENWLDTIGDSIDFVPTDIANAAVSNLSTQVVEQFNSNSSACGKMKITSNRSRTTTVTETDTINTVQKW